MHALPTRLPDVLLLEPRVFSDERGYFCESFNAQTFAQLTGCSRSFVQDNRSHSKRGVLRGLHYQVSPHAQDKLVCCLSGEIYDVAVDLRRSSATFKQWVGVHLNGEQPQQLWIPAGFAHGFLVLSEQADVVYKVTDFYAPECERTLRWDDPELSIRWPLSAPPLLSAKDAAGPRLSNAALFP